MTYVAINRGPEEAIYEEILTKNILIDTRDNNTTTKQNGINLRKENQHNTNPFAAISNRNGCNGDGPSAEYETKSKPFEMVLEQNVNKRNEKTQSLGHNSVTAEEMNLFHDERSQSVDDLKDLMMTSTSMFIARETEREIAIMNERNMRSKSKSMRDVSSAAATPRPLVSRKSMPSSTFQKTLTKTSLRKSDSDNTKLYVISDKTEYSEILSDVAVSEITTGRPTRESENPILRVQVLSSSCGSVGSDSSNHSSINDIPRSTNPIEYGEKNTKGVYENIDSPTLSNSDTSQAHSTVDGKANSLKKERRFQSFYENTPDDNIDAIARNRCLSQSCSGSEIQHNNTKKYSKSAELLYSDLDFGNNTDDLMSLSSQSSRDSSSLSSSGCTSSSLSSSVGQSVFQMSGGFSNVPPPLPRPRNGVTSLVKRPIIQGWSQCNALGSSYFKALYLGAFAISRPCFDHVDLVIKDAVHKISMTDTISIFVDVNNDTLKFGTSYSPWELISQFNVDDIHCVESYSKDLRLLGIVVSQVGCDAKCYVLQSDDATLIADAIRAVFKSQPKVFSRWSANDRPPTLNMDFSPSEQSFCFQNIIHIGRVRVKQSYLVINESIRVMLKNVPPREYRAVNFGVVAQSVVISNPSTGIDEETQSIPWILSLGVYEKDSRYFGYIVTDNKTHGKMSYLCYVYRCSRVITAAEIIGHLRLACQNTYQYNTTIQSHSNNDNQPIHDEHKSRKISTSKRNDHHQPITKRLSRILMVNKDHKETEEVLTHEPTDSTDDVKTIANRQRISSQMIKNPFKRSTEKQTNDIENVPFYEPKIINITFQTFYLCSTVINPPLKAKYVRECYKQFCKQMQKHRKNTNGNLPGSLLNLNLNSSTGITMADPKDPNNSKREFPIEIIENYSENPENAYCFAFSTSVCGDTKHKCHVFCFDNTKEDVINSLRRNFEELLKIKEKQ